LSSSFRYNSDYPAEFMRTKIKMLRITGFLDFAHSPEFEIFRKHNVSETGSVFFFR
jgi:hypothetical protein